MLSWLTLLFTLIIAPAWVSTISNRYPSDTAVNNSPVAENFAILIENNPENYILEQKYNDLSDNTGNHDSVMPPAYSQKLASERVTDRLKSPGFHPPTAKPRVQEFCFEKPIVVRRNCPGETIISNFWLYDADDRECKVFVTNNCDDNKNKFRSIEACEAECLEPILKLEPKQFQPEQNSEIDQFDNQFGPTNTYGRSQQNYNRNYQPRERNQFNYNQRRVENVI